jgi:hypothetical protein
MVWMNPPWSLSATSKFQLQQPPIRMFCGRCGLSKVSRLDFFFTKLNVIPSIKPEPMVKRQSYWSRELYLNQHLMLFELETD